MRKTNKRNQVCRNFIFIEIRKNDVSVGFTSAGSLKVLCAQLNS